MNNQLHILIIDDDRFQVLALKKVIELTSLAGEITHCLNGQEALDYLTQLTQQGDTLPDVIFLDINMPIMNGWHLLEAYKRLKRLLYHPIPIYLLTSSTDGVDMAKSRRYETVKGYIIKPAAKEKVREILMSIETE